MKVWIDQELCLGDGHCEELAPDVFCQRADGRYVVMESDRHFGVARIYDGLCFDDSGPAGDAGLAKVPPELADDVISAVEHCEARAIYLTE